MRPSDIDWCAGANVSGSKRNTTAKGGGATKVVPRGLEPRTLRLLAVRSNQLSYETNDDFEEDHLILAEVPNQMADEHMIQHSPCNFTEIQIVFSWLGGGRGEWWAEWTKIRLFR